MVSKHKRIPVFKNQYQKKSHKMGDMKKQSQQTFHQTVPSTASSSPNLLN